MLEAGAYYKCPESIGNFNSVLRQRGIEPVKSWQEFHEIATSLGYKIIKKEDEFGTFKVKHLEAFHGPQV